MYVPLRVHGWHSLLTGVDPPAALLARAAELGLEALALTDVDGLSGSTDFLRAAARRGWESGQLHHDSPRTARDDETSSANRGGVVLTPYRLGAETSDPGGADTVTRVGRVIALVRGEGGYRNLCKLVSARRLGDDPGEAGAALGGPDAFDLVEATRRFRHPSTRTAGGRHRVC